MYGNQAYGPQPKLRIRGILPADLRHTLISLGKGPLFQHYCHYMLLSIHITFAYTVYIIMINYV